MTIETALQVAAGGCTCGAFLIWFAKLMAARLIKQYDEKHADHEKRLRELSEKFAEHLTDLKIKLAKLEPMVISAVSLRDDLKLVENGVAVLRHVASKTNADLNHAHSQIRVIQKHLEESRGSSKS